MSLRRVRLPSDLPGQLWLGPMPGRFTSWGSFQQQAQGCELSVVVCLTPRPEMQELSPEYHAAVAGGRLPFRWLQLPMRNFGVPDDPAGFRREVEALAQGVRQGDRVLLHCAAGIGRTGTVAACVLKALGLEANEAMQRVRDAGSNPQNAEQSGVVRWF
ncbi:protein-tyrosine phosphatase family protein [Ramlibacter pallidus]|uniref:Dual specificity protein phosphatase family protein n=1 Tax=Ramlibacter pallidus TaxID=2780087 RepID=A0ABR9S4T0_9BURK|nr:tyrosine-protein phosphatase [Ramlibacter pallidus]MBE7368517.1 dual specificity protein phosphatase family protein [Ramlibacter pallidus]